MTARLLFIYFIGVTGKLKAGPASTSGDCPIVDFNTALVETLADPSKRWYVPGVSISRMPDQALKKGEQGILAGEVLYDTLQTFPGVAPLLRMLDPERGTAVFPDAGRTNGMTLYKQCSFTPFHLDGYYGTKACKFIPLGTLNNGRFIHASTLLRVPLLQLRIYT